MILTPKMLFDGKFEIICELGQGGMGHVYKALQCDFQRVVALKVLSLRSLNAEARLRLQREAIAMSSLNHPGLVKVYSYGEFEGLPYIVMEYVEGPTLHSKLVNQQPLAVDTTLALAAKLCEALQYTHASGIVHRDLKPENIVLVAKTGTESGGVKIIDLGLARIVPESGMDVQKLTETGMALGSVQYMSPEQCVGRKVDGRSDIYSLGVILFQCLTGVPPFTAETAIGCMMLQTTADVPLLNSLNSEVDVPGLQHIVDKALAKDPDGRYQSAAEMLADVELVRAGGGTQLAAASVRAQSGAAALSVQPRWKAPLLVGLALCVLSALIAVPWLKISFLPTSRASSAQLYEQIRYLPDLQSHTSPFEPGPGGPIQTSTARLIEQCFEADTQDHELSQLPASARHDMAMALTGYYNVHPNEWTLPGFQQILIANKTPNCLRVKDAFADKHRAEIALDAVAFANDMSTKLKLELVQNVSVTCHPALLARLERELRSLPTSVFLYGLRLRCLPTLAYRYAECGDKLHAQCLIREALAGLHQRYVDRDTKFTVLFGAVSPDLCDRASVAAVAEELQDLDLDESLLCFLAERYAVLSQTSAVYGNKALSAHLRRLSRQTLARATGHIDAQQMHLSELAVIAVSCGAADAAELRGMTKSLMSITPSKVSAESFKHASILLLRRVSQAGTKSETESLINYLLANLNSLDENHAYDVLGEIVRYEDINKLKRLELLLQKPPFKVKSIFSPNTALLRAFCFAALGYRLLSYDKTHARELNDKAVELLEGLSPSVLENDDQTEFYRTLTGIMALNFGNFGDHKKLIEYGTAQLDHVPSGRDYVIDGSIIAWVMGTADLENDHACSMAAFHKLCELTKHRAKVAASHLLNEAATTMAERGFKADAEEVRRTVKTLPVPSIR